MGIGYGILCRIISVLVIAAVSGLLTYATARAAPCTLTATDINGYTLMAILLERVRPLPEPGPRSFNAA